MYYSTEARMSAISCIRDLNAKIGEIPGNILSYTDARQVTTFLNILADQIKKEDKEAYK